MLSIAGRTQDQCARTTERFPLGGDCQHLQADEEPLFTDEGVAAVLKGCRQLKELAICSAPEVTSSALMRVIIDERLMLRKIEFGGKGQITASHVRKFRRMAKKAKLLPVPIVLLHSK